MFRSSLVISSENVAAAAASSSSSPSSQKGAEKGAPTLMSYTAFRDRDRDAQITSVNVKTGATSASIGDASLRLSAPPSVLGHPVSSPDLSNVNSGNGNSDRVDKRFHPLPPFSLWVTQDDDNNNNKREVGSSSVVVNVPGNYQSKFDDDNWPLYTRAPVSPRASFVPPEGASFQPEMASFQPEVALFQFDATPSKEEPAGETPTFNAKTENVPSVFKDSKTTAITTTTTSFAKTTSTAVTPLPFKTKELRSSLRMNLDPRQGSGNSDSAGNGKEWSGCSFVFENGRVHWLRERRA